MEIDDWGLCDLLMIKCLQYVNALIEGHSSQELQISLLRCEHLPIVNKNIGLMKGREY